jgi:predicted lactoylglutathione lyase
MDIINYAKYENMNKKQLSKHLKKAKKKYKKLNKKLNKQLKKNKKLMDFLIFKLIKISNNKFATLKKSKSFKNFRKKFAKISESERAQLIAEVEAQMNRDYDDD